MEPRDPLMLVLPRPEIEALNLRPFLRRFGAGAFRVLKLRHVPNRQAGSRPPPEVEQR